MELKNIRFNSVKDLMFILNRNVADERVQGASPDELIKVMKNTDKKITAHLYSIMPGSKKNTILGEARMSAQLYAAVDKKIYYCIGGGWGSSRREWHNHMIDAMLSDEELRKNIPAAVIVTGYGKLLSYYYHESYAFLNQDLDSNWHKNLRKRLGFDSDNGVVLPYTERRREDCLEDIVLIDSGKETNLFRAFTLDLASKKFYENLRKKKFD